MKECVVYHWWGGPDDDPPMHNKRTPIVASIATLRGCNSSIPIFVLDGSAIPQDYGDLPNRLGFKVVPWDFHLKSYDGTKGWQHLSRLFDVNRFASTIDAEIILYSDTDVFWKNDPLPLQQDPSLFCYNKYNSGFFYFNKKTLPPRFFEIFEAYTITALNDENFRYVSGQYSYTSPDYFVFDEAILGYMCNKHPWLFNRLSLQEHCTTSGIAPENNDISSVKMVHANGISVRNELEKITWKKNYSRGLIPLLIQEFGERFRSVLKFSEVYTQEELDTYLPKQVKLADPTFLQVLLATKTQDGLLDLMTAINRFHQGKAG